MIELKPNIVTINPNFGNSLLLSYKLRLNCY